MTLDIPKMSLVVLIGPSGAGKSTFARTHFAHTEIVSSDTCRGLVSDDENDLSATSDAFDLVEYIAGKRLKNGLLTVIDATSVRPEDRKRYVELARRHHCLPVAIVLRMPESLCQERNAGRPDRDFGPHVVRRQLQSMRRGIGRSGKGLWREGFRKVWVLESAEEVAAAQVERVPLWNDKRDVRGPFDVIGDVHGCFDELVELIDTLGYEIDRDPSAPEGDWSLRPPTGDDGVARQLVFVGDLVDRGPKSPAVLRLVMRAVEEGAALCVPGNHDVKLMRKLSGRQVQITHGLAETLEQLDGETESFLESVRRFIDGLVSHYVLDGGALVVAHAGLREDLQGRGSRTVRDFCLYGDTTGETDERGLPERRDWAADYRGPAMVVYGHTTVPEAEWLNRTINIDTGCVFGGKLTALRYPERDIVSVPARATYAEPMRPFLPAPMGGASSPGGDRLSAQQRHDDMLHLEDVLGKRIIDTALQRNIMVREDQATATLETMSRFAADPRWLIHLPPTMSPSETSERGDFLEHPAEAFEHYRMRGLAEVVCEEKHMGSRAIVIVCRDEAAARSRFGVTSGEAGIVVTRTGRRFFDDAALEAAFVGRVRAAIEAADMWASFETDWFCLDAELMPWSAKARALLRDQYAAVGASGRAAMADVVPALEATLQRSGDAAASSLLAAARLRHEAIDRYVTAYRQYCWDVTSLDDYRLAPFHVLASEGRVHVDRDHLWHLETIGHLVEHDPILMATTHRLVDLNDAASVAAATEWWLEMTRAGGEGMVVKPRSFVARGTRGIVQPAVKCRGPEYLRIIYGPEYQRPQHLERLRRRGLRHKRSLAMREFALGVESLERFVRREPLRRVHECVFGVLALESEPVDPRL